MDHIHELRGRLFWIALMFLVTSAAAYPFRDLIIAFLVAPLGNQQLYYLTPVGGFSFIIKVCTYVGIVAALPAVIFHIYRYLEPAVGRVRKRIVIGYVLFSTVLALTGIGFAYFVSLPAALHFLTGFDLKSVTAMLTIDSYFSFVTTYLIGAALLFQLPLLLLIINSIITLPPKKLMSYQRHMLLGAFVVAAIISPTPDVTNQALLAIPIIVMYQIGIVLVWLSNMGKKPRNKFKTPAIDSVAPVATTRRPLVDQTDLDEVALALNRQMAQQQQMIKTKPKQPHVAKPSVVSIVHKPTQPPAAVVPQVPKVSVATLPQRRSRPPLRTSPAMHHYRTKPSPASSVLTRTNANRQPVTSAPKSIDGFSVPNKSLA